MHWRRAPALTLVSSMPPGLVRKLAKDGVKLLGEGEVDRVIHLKVQKCSESARRKIESAGGSVEIVALAVKPEDKSE